MQIPSQMIHTSDRSSRWSRAALVARSVAFLCAAATTVNLQAQSAAVSSASAVSTSTRPSLDFRAALATPLNLANISDNTSSGESSSSSSVATDTAADAVDAERFSLSSDSTQPPPRRRYGRPRYNDNSHNADGSKKLTFELGVGMTVPVGGTHDYSKLNYKFQGGVGRNFNQHFGVLAQFDWDNFGIQTATLNNLLTIYQNLCGSSCTGSQIQRIGGNTHIWSFSINPIYNIAQSEKMGAYVVGGVGFYHKATNITTPVTGTYCDYYYGCYNYPANASIDKYNSNAPGYSGGIGFTYRPSRFSGERFFAEARYVYIANQARPYYDGTTGTKLSPTYFNVFPQNSATTSYVPITIGLRF